MLRMIQLARECETFCRYLIRNQPTDYVVRKYQEYHSTKIQLFEAVSLFDRSVLKFARLHPATTLLVDAYCRWFCRHSVLRRKLFLTLAILECCAPSYREIDSVVTGGKPKQMALMVLRVAMALVVHVVSVVALLPWQMICGITDTLRRSAKATT